VKTIEPHRVAFTDHAAERAERYGVSRGDIADAVLEHHPQRRRNPGPADWRVARGRLVVVYDWPDGDDDTTARVVTLWLAGYARW
jgi:hypothetical protein